MELTYVGRPKAASPSEGSKRRHEVEQGRFLSAVLSEFAEAQPERRQERRKIEKERSRPCPLKSESRRWESP